MSASTLLLLAAFVVVLTIVIGLTLNTRAGALEDRLGVAQPIGVGGLAESEFSQSFAKRVLAPFGTSIGAYIAERTQKQSLDAVNRQLRMAAIPLSAGAFLAINLGAAILAAVVGILVML